MSKKGKVENTITEDMGKRGYPVASFSAFSESLCFLLRCCFFHCQERAIAGIFFLHIDIRGLCFRTFLKTVKDYELSHKEK